VRACPLPFVLACAWVLACGAPSRPDALPSPKIQGDVVAIDPKSPQLGSLAVEAARPRTPETLSLSGRLAWSDDVTVRVYAPVAGRVKRLLASLGQVLRPGDGLAVIDSPDMGQAQADARKADGDLELARRTLTRLRDLHEHGAAAQKDVESAQADLVRASSEAERAHARLLLYGSRAPGIDGSFTLKTPIGGTLVERNVSPGQEVRPDQMLASDASVMLPLFVITSPAALWLWVDVPEVDLASLRAGQTLRVRSRAYPDRVFEGRLDLIGAALDPATRTVRVRGSVANTQGLLKAEMYVSVEVADEGAVAEGVDLPAKALFLHGDQPYVFVEEEAGRFRRQAVRTGSERAGRISIVEGLVPGQRVVTDGTLLLQKLIDDAAGA